MLFYVFRSCSAEVGYTGRRQTVNLHSKCWKKGIVIHELGKRSKVIAFITPYFFVYNH